MNELKRAKLVEELENPNLTQDERNKLTYKLFKLDNRPEWGLKIFFGSIIISMLIITIIFTSK